MLAHAACSVGAAPEKYDESFESTKLCLVRVQERRWRRAGSDIYWAPTVYHGCLFSNRGWRRLQLWNPQDSDSPTHCLNLQGT